MRHGMIYIYICKLCVCLFPEEWIFLSSSSRCLAFLRFHQLTHCSVPFCIVLFTFFLAHCFLSLFCIFCIALSFCSHEDSFSFFPFVTLCIHPCPVVAYRYCYNTYMEMAFVLIIISFFFFLFSLCSMHRKLCNVV